MSAAAPRVTAGGQPARIRTSKGKARLAKHLSHRLVHLLLARC